MATYTWPTGRAFTPASFSWGVRANDRVFESSLNGSVQTASVPGTRWAATLQFTNQTAPERAALEAFLVRARREHRVALHRLDRPRPRGTVALAGVTLQSSAAAFASQLTLAGCGANATLLAGDMLGLGGQLCMVAADATANGSGVATVALTHELRQAASAGAAITLDKPTALFIQTSPELDMPWLGTHHPGFTVELREVFA